MDIRLKNLDYAFNPRSIAFVGATEPSAKWGFLILNNLIKGGYEGDIYPVNPGRETVLGMRAYPSVLDIPAEVDLAVFTVPSRLVMEAIKDCIEKKVKAGLVITAGFKELGETGAGMEARMVGEARAGGMLLIGPNCQGICCPKHKLYPWMPVLYHPPGGKIGYVAQSGNILNMLIGQAVSGGLGVSKAISSGNEADIVTDDYYDYLAEDPDTEVIVSYVEGISDGRSFIDHARRVSDRKPIVVLKGGRTSSGISAARSHTGAMAVSERLFEAACRQVGLVFTTSIEEAGITAASFVNRPLPSGKRVGIITGGGGLGVIAADFCTEVGLEVPQLSPGTLEKLGDLLPDWWSPGNPVDLVAGLNFEIIKPVIEILMRSSEVDAVMFLWIGAPRRKEPERESDNPSDTGVNLFRDRMENSFVKLSTEVYAMMHELQVPLYFATSMRQAEMEEFLGDDGGNWPLLFPSVESACRSLKAMADYQTYRAARE